MNELPLVSAEQMRQCLRERLRGRKARLWDAPAAGEQPGPHSRIEILGKFRAKQKARQDLGIINPLKNWLFEPASPFDPERRRLPRREVVAVGCLAILLLGAVCWFNFFNSR
jgi:hypothetical protein